MSTIFFLTAVISAISLGGLLIWALSGTSEKRARQGGIAVLADAPRHLTNLAQIRQVLDTADLKYVTERAGPELAARLKKERRRVTLLYLKAIRQDFEQLLRIARVLAVLSPEVSGAHDYQRLRLALTFRCKFQLVKLQVTIGRVALPEVTALGQMVTSLALEMELAMEKLGERAALAADLAIRSET
jgi:hypothetical protein